MKSWQRWFLRRNWESEMQDEMRDHIERQIATNIAAGMAPLEARRQAILQFGGVEGAKENCREQRRGFWLETLCADARYTLRILRKNPVFAVIAILTLALGIGSSSAVFSVVDRILFRSLPYPQDDRLVSYGLLAPIEPREFMIAIDYLEWRKATTPFAQTAAMYPGSVDCDLTEQNPLRVNCALVESTFLPTFGVQPILGRNFTHDAELPNAPGVALLTYGLWRSRYGGDPAVIGKSISLDGQATQILGVLPADFEMPTLSRADLLVPLTLHEAGMRRDGPQLVLRTFARLKPGVTVAQSQAALQPLFEQSLKYVPPMFRNEVHVSVRSLRDRQVQDAKIAAWVLFGAVLGVLLLACTNVANLLLARARVRQREIAVRAALGATPARLARQALTESLLLSLLGGAAGCWIAYGLLRLFVSIAPEGIPRLQQATLDLRVLFFTLAITVLSGVLFGLAPAWKSPEPEVLSGKEGRSAIRSPLRQLLVTSQIAISLVLLSGAGLLLRTLWNLQRVPLGLDAQNVLAAEITLAPSRYPGTPQQREFFRQLEERVQRIPGVSSVAISDSLPPFGAMEATIYSQIEVAGRPHADGGTGGMVGWRAVTPGYFTALGIRFLKGRGFQEDGVGPGNSMVLSDSLARRMFPGEEALGKNVRFGVNGPWRTVVGIASDVRNNGLENQSDPEFLIPWKESPGNYFGRAFLIVRTPVEQSTMLKWIRLEIANLDPQQPATFETMNQRVVKLADRPRFNAALLSLFALIGISLAAIGMYGVVGFLVTQRTREIGLRMALGATPGGILNLVLGSVARWTFAGALLGLAGSWFAARLLRSLLFEVQAHNPWLLAMAVGALVAIGFAAAWIPARRAMRVDPMVALRYE